MCKIRKNLFMALSFAMAISAIGAATSLKSAPETAAAATAEALYVKEGASIRMDVSTDDSGNVVIGSNTGIRYTAVASAELVKSLVETTDGVTAYKSGAKLGMFIVPKKAIDKYEAQKDTEGGESDYFEYFSSINNAITEDAISYVCKAEDLSSTTDNEYNVSIVDIETVNYTEEYQAVAYYVLDGAYYYSAASDTRSVAYVADEALLDTQSTYSQNQKTALGNIIEKYIALSNGEEGKYEKTVATLASFDLKATYAAPINATDLEYTVDDTDVSIDGTTLTGLSTDGVADVNVKAYGGYVDFTLQVTTKAEKGEQQNLVSGTATASYTAYGATVGNVETSAFTNDPVINDVTLGIGTVSEGSTLQNMGKTNFSYLAFKTDNGYTTNRPVTIEFTGNNMPLISYYVEDDSENTPMENVVDQKGILLTNGFKLDKNTTNASLLDRLTLYGYKKMTNNAVDKDNDDTTVGELDTRLISVKSVTNYTDTEESSLNISYNELSEDPTQRYRLFVVTNYTDSLLSFTVALYKIAEGDYNGELVFYYANKKLSGPVAGSDAITGNIVLYGRPYETTKLDKVHYIPSQSAYVSSGVAYGQIADFAPTTA